MNFEKQVQLSLQRLSFWSPYGKKSVVF